jgi:hypothetical protein
LRFVIVSAKAVRVAEELVAFRHGRDIGIEKAGP